MFEVRTLKRRIKSIERSYPKERDKLKNAKASQDVLAQLESSKFDAVRELEKEIDQILGLRLSHEARSLDVEVPPISDTEMWDEEFGRRWFTSKGRAQVRKLIHEEKTRRFEAKSRWIPLLSVLLGIISTSTAMVALLQQKKSVDAATTAAGTARIGVELARKQLGGTLGAVVVFVPFIEGSKLHPVLENRGHVVSPNAHINFHWSTSALSAPGRIIQAGEYSRTIPQLVVGGFGDMFDIGLDVGEEFPKQKYTTRIEGTYDFDNGFGDRFTETFCSVYLGQRQTKSDTGAIETTGGGFIPCDIFAEKLRYARTHPPQ